ncbi:MAG: hypothetical protein QOF93_22, partial [Verrucomicrobiota bacterium]
MKSAAGRHFPAIEHLKRGCELRGLSILEIPVAVG